MKILLTRTAENNTRTAAKLTRLGHEPICIALGELVYLVPEATRLADAVMFTSSEAVDVLSNRGIVGNSTIEVFCVGERTKQSAQKIGFENFISVTNSAEELSHAIKEHYAGKEVKICYFSGRNRSFDFKEAFAGTNIALDLTELYDIKRIVPEREKLEASLDAAKGGIQFHYSAQSAAYFFDLIAKFGLEKVSKTMNAVTISNKTSLAVDKSLVKSVQNAKIATEAAMIAMIEEL